MSPKSMLENMLEKRNDIFPCSAYISPVRSAHPMCASKIALKRKILRHKSTKIAMQMHNMPRMEVMNRLIESEVSKRQVRKNVHLM